MSVILELASTECILFSLRFSWFFMISDFKNWNVEILGNIFWDLRSYLSLSLWLFFLKNMLQRGVWEHGLITARWKLKSTWPPQIPFWIGGVGMPSYWSPCDLQWHHRGWEWSFMLSSSKRSWLSSEPPLTLLQQGGAGVCHYCWVGVGPQFFLQCLAGLKQLLYTSLSFSAAPFLAFWLGRALFCGNFFICAHWYFQVAGIFSSKSGLHEAKRKPTIQQPYLLVFLRPPGSKVPSQLLFFTFQFHVAFVLCMKFRIFSCI